MVLKFQRCYDVDDDNDYDAKGSVKEKWKSLMTFAIKHRTPPPSTPSTP